VIDLIERIPPSRSDHADQTLRENTTSPTFKNDSSEPHPIEPVEKPRMSLKSPDAWEIDYETQIVIVTLIAAAFSLSGCFSKAATPMANWTPTQHTSANSLDWYGSYAGVVPPIVLGSKALPERPLVPSGPGIWARTTEYLNVKEPSSGKKMEM
jgi:hypothetical protein